MATAGGRLLSAAAAHSGRVYRAVPRLTPAVPLVPCRSATVTRSGAILPKPVKVSEGRAGGGAANRGVTDGSGGQSEREHLLWVGRCG